MHIQSRRCAISLLLAAIMLLLPCTAYAATGDEGGAYNIILLIDKSGSMNYTDPEHIAVNAGKMFIDSLYTGVKNKREIGIPAQVGVRVVPFSENPDGSNMFRNLETDADTEAVTQSIDKIVYDPVNTGATDLGKAVAFGVDCLENIKDGIHKGLIVLFTDGYTYYLSNNPRKKELEAASIHFLDEALELSKNAGYEIYVIGLNHVDSQNGSDRITAQGRGEIARIANSTQMGYGLNRSGASEGEMGTNYLITSSLDEIQEFYIGLFSSMMGGSEPISAEEGAEQQFPDSEAANGPYSFYDIPVESAETTGVSCVNIYVTSEKDLDNLLVMDSSGTLITPSDPQVSIQKDSSGKYAIVSLWHPTSGKWHLGVRSSDRPVTVKSVSISGVHLQTEAVVSDGEAVITVQAVNETGAMGEDFYKDVQSICQVERKDGGTLEKFKLSYSSDSNALTGSVPITDSGDYTIKTTIQTSLFTRTSTLETTLDPSAETVLDTKHEEDLDQETNQETIKLLKQIAEQRIPLVILCGLLLLLLLIFLLTRRKKTRNGRGGTGGPSTISLASAGTAANPVSTGTVGVNLKKNPRSHGVNLKKPQNRS